MTDQNKGTQRAPWAKPELRRIEAGSAEARVPSGKNDVGGTGQVNKS